MRVTSSEKKSKQPRSGTYAWLFPARFALRFSWTQKTGAHLFLFFGTMKPLDKRLGRVIRAARDRRGITQEELANRCGISRRHVAGIERGANFTVAVLVAIAGELTQIAPVIAEFLTLAANRTSPVAARDRSSSH